MVGRGTSPWLPLLTPGYKADKEGRLRKPYGTQRGQSNYDLGSGRLGILTWLMSRANVLDCLQSLLGLNLEFRPNVNCMEKYDFTGLFQTAHQMSFLQMNCPVLHKS